MKSTNITIVVLVILALVAGGVYIANTDKMKGDEAMMADKAMMKDDKAMMSDDKSMMKGDEAMMADKAMMSGDKMADKSMMSANVTSGYLPYSPEKLAYAEKGNVVLFFRAGWCPTCRTVDADIRANLGKVPSNLVILDVNYDASADLKKKYGVTVQHTFVQVDSNGNLIKKWIGGANLASVVAQVQ